METLPPEMMTYILALLPYSARKNMAMMNKTWYYASLHPTLMRKEFLVYYEPTDHQQKEECLLKFNFFKNALIKTERTLLKLKLQDPTIYHSKFLTILEIAGDRLVELHLTTLFAFTDGYLNALSKYCKNIEKLKLVNIKQFSVIVKPDLPMTKLRSITFHNDSNIFDLEFNMIIQCAPNLEHLGFKECFILCWPQAIRRYYPDFQNQEQLLNYNSDIVFTDVNIINYFKTAQNIKSLKLENYYHIFYQLPEHIKLNYLSVNLSYTIEDSYIDNEMFKLKLGQHTSLKKLFIIDIPCCFLSAVSKLYNLNNLSLLYTTDVLSNCRDKAACVQTFYDSLVNMKNLKKLRITQRRKCRGDTELLTPKIPDVVLSSLKPLDF